MLAAEQGYLDVAMSLIEHTPEFDLKKKCGETALFIAAWIDQIWMLQLLLEHGNNINATTNYGGTMLMIAVEKSHLFLAWLLVEKKCEKFRK